MTSKIVACILGIAIGAGICAAVLSKKTSNTTAASAVAVTTALSNQIASLEASLASSKARLEQAERVNDDLNTRVRELMKKEAVNAAQPAPETPAKRTGFAAMFGDGTNGTSGPMAEMMKTALEQQIEGKLSGMKAKLNLSPEQERAIREIMTRQMTMGTEIAKKMLSGELSQEEVEKMGKDQAKKDQANPEKQITAVLTPEQLALYDEFEKEERARMARLTANSELMQIQSQLQLTEEQQDKVFAVLADQALGQFNGNTNSSSDPFSFRGQFDRKADALKDVLTPEQLERYRKFQEQQAKLIESFMPRSASNATVISVTPVVAQ